MLEGMGRGSFRGRAEESDLKRSTSVRRLVSIIGIISLSVNLGWLNPEVQAASVSELSARAKQARSKSNALKKGGWTTQSKLQAIQVLGPVALEFVAIPNLAKAVKTASGKKSIRAIYETLHNPLNDIYTSSFNRLDQMTKRVIEQDGDLEAVQDSKAYRDEQGVVSRALYFLNWLNYIGSFTYDEKKKEKLLTQAMNGFGEFAVGDQASRIKNESLFGRALSERELQKFDWAVRDFELLLKQPGVSADMKRKAQSALKQTRKYAKRGSKTPSSPADVAQSNFQLAKSLIKKSEKARGKKRRELRGQILALILELRKAGGKWPARADALIETHLTREEELVIAEQENPFPPWLKAKEHMQKRRFAKAVPFLEEVLASNDPNAAVYKTDANYYLGVGLYEQRRYRQAITKLDAFLSNGGAKTKHAPDAQYFQFKSAESLYAGNQNDQNGKLYVKEINDFTRKYPRHRSIYEAHFRLGEYYQEQENYLKAVDAYKKVRGAPAYRVRSDYATLQSYFEVLHAIEDGDTSNGLSEGELRKRIGASLDDYWKNSAKLAEANPKLVKREPYANEYPGKVVMMNAVHLGHDLDANAEEIVSLLDGFEEKYPKHPDAFETAARTRLIALQKTGRYAELEKDVDKIYDRYETEKQEELLAGLSGVLEKDIRKLRRQKDNDNAVFAKRTLARLQEEWLKGGGEFAEDESPDRFRYDLAQLYLDTKQYDKAEVIYKDLEQKQGAYSIVSTVGLAQISEVRGNKKRALSLWEAMLKGTQVGDPLWFRGTFEVARLNDTLGNSTQACKTVNSAQKMLNRLGDQGLKTKIKDFASQTCGA